MKKFMFFIFFILFFFIIDLFCNRTAYLKDLLNPDSMMVNEDKLYVVDGARVLTYSLKDFNLLGTFGKQGEGPGELTAQPYWANQISLHKQNIFLEGLTKYMLVNKDGQLIQEKRKTRRFIKILPVGNNYVVRTFPLQLTNQKFFEIIKIVNSEMEDVRELFRLNTTFLNRGLNQFPVIPDSINFCVYQERIYIEDSRKGFLIRVFDSSGNDLYRIKKEFPRIQVTKKMIQREMEHIKESFKQKRLSVCVPMEIGEQGWEFFKKWATFTSSEYLPSIKDILVKENRIYLQTYQKKGGKEEYIILDLKGNLLKRIFLPQLKSFALYDSFMLGAGVKFYDFSGNSFIYMDEDEDEEIWKVMQVEF